MAKEYSEKKPQSSTENEKNSKQKSQNKDTKNNKENYLYIVKYESDAERKRAEYPFNNLNKENVEKVEGLVRIVQTENEKDLHKDLASRVGEKNVESYKLKDIEVEIQKKSRKVKREIQTSSESIEGFLKYVLSKKNAVLKSSKHNLYHIYTRKGKVKVKYRIKEQKNKVKIIINLEGIPPAPEFLKNFFEEELEEYEVSQK